MDAQGILAAVILSAMVFSCFLFVMVIVIHKKCKELKGANKVEVISNNNDVHVDEDSRPQPEYVDEDSRPEDV